MWARVSFLQDLRYRKEAKIPPYSISTCKAYSADGLVRMITICIAAIKTKDISGRLQNLDGLIRHGLGLSKSLRRKSGDNCERKVLHLV